jgi:hypothetical protein
MEGVFYADVDNPFSCPLDGARTVALSDDGETYIEQCLFCQRVFKFQFEEHNDVQ